MTYAPPLTGRTAAVMHRFPPLGRYCRPEHADLKPELSVRARQRGPLANLTYWCDGVEVSHEDFFAMLVYWGP